jgi:hypothetical protein
MGYNRSGVRRTARLKRAKKHEARLAKQAAELAGAEPKTLVDQVKDAAAGVAHAVGAAFHAVTETLAGKKDEKHPTPPNA